MLVIISSPRSGHLTCCRRSPIITYLGHKTAGRPQRSRLYFFTYEKHIKLNHLIRERHVSQLKEYQINALEFDVALVSRVDIKCSVVNTEDYVDCQVQLECKINVNQNREKAHSCMIWQLSLFYLMVPILLSHRKMTDLPIATSKIIISSLFVWLSHWQTSVKCAFHVN